jgi:cobalt-zinc-cadmium resistance protein CzcA
LEEVATVALKNGPNQIQRDDAKRRITIGFNVRNRDVQTIVSEIQQKLNKVKFPAGYYVTYGGQFENLRAANKRLSIAVPVALLLILLLLYFTFSSIRETLLIFTAIPLSAIGGVLALAIRGMPFSISAGVGFIALFGVAVLNGIVLIGEFNRLEKEGMHDIYQRVLAGTKTRLRPVLMTAAVASLGFLPMALSGSSGAEVQRPLATVVIGGLLSATLLTLIVLPILYILFERKKKPGGSKSAASPVVLLLLLAGLFLPSTSAAQTDSSSTPRQLTLQQALDEAKQNSSYLKAGRYEVDFQKSLKSGTLNLEATISYQQGQLNSINRDNYFNITQKIEFPTVYSSQSVLATAKVESTERQFRVRESELKRNVKAVYYRLQYLLEKKNLLLFEDSLYQRLAKSSKIRYQSGESTRLELVTSETQLQEIKNSFVQNEGDTEISQQQLQTLLNSKSSVSVYNQKLGKSSLPTVGDSLNIALNPYLNYLKQDVLVRQKETDVQKAKRLPDFTFGYFNQSITGLQNVTGTEQNFTRRDRFMGFQAGIAVPILPGGYRAKINASKISELIATENVNYEQNNLEGNLNQLIRQYNKSGSTIDYYQNSALKQADLIIKNAELGFKGGEISYIQFIQSMSMALKIKSDYLDQLYSQQKIVLDVEALLGDK